MRNITRAASSNRTSVNIVAEEQIVGVGRESSILEQPKQIIILSVDIACSIQIL